MQAPPVDELPADIRVELQQTALLAQLSAIQAVQGATKKVSAETLRDVKAGFSTYRLLLRRRRRRLAREAALLEEAAGEELIDGRTHLEKLAHRAESGGTAGESTTDRAEVPTADGKQLSEDEIFDMVEAMDLPTITSACDKEGIAHEGSGLDDIKAELIERLMSQSGGAGLVAHGGASAKAVHVGVLGGDPELVAEYTAAIEEMDEEAAVDECEKEGIDWMALPGLEEIKAALMYHYCGGPEPGALSEGLPPGTDYHAFVDELDEDMLLQTCMDEGLGNVPGESPEEMRIALIEHYTRQEIVGNGGTDLNTTSADDVYAELIDEMDEETALETCEEEGLELPPGASLADAQALLREHFLKGPVGGAADSDDSMWSWAKAAQQEVLDVPKAVLPLVYESLPEEQEQLESFGYVQASRLESATTLLRVAAESKNIHLFSHALAVIPELDLQPPPPSGEGGSSGYDGRPPPGVQPYGSSDAAALMAKLRPYQTGGPLPPPGLVPNACRGVAALARSLGDSMRKALAREGAVQLFSNWLSQLSTDQVTIAGCEVLEALCLDIESAQDMVRGDGLAAVLAILTDGSKQACFPAAAGVLVNIVTHQPEDPSLATAVVQNSDGTGGILTDGFGAIFTAMKLLPDPEFHVQICKMLFFLTADEGNRSLAAQGRYMSTLDKLFLDHVHDHEVEAVSHVGTVWAQLCQGSCAFPVSQHLAQHCLPGISAAFQEFPNELTVQRVMICVVASMGVNSQIKLEVCHNEMLDCVVTSMARFRDSAELQEQACRAINAISKGEESIKEYLASRQGDLPVIESIIDALDNFRHDEGVVLAGCSAVWSVAFKNLRMKNRAGELGAFPTIMDVIRTHSRVSRILPHAFVAIGNLSANHAPNQALCGQEGVVDLCLEFMPMHRRDATIVYTILSCLSAVMVGQPDNVAKFQANDGMIVVQRVAARHTDQQVQRCVRSVHQAVEHDQQTRQQKQKGRRGSLMGSAAGMLELTEMGREPMSAFPLSAKATVLMQGKCHVKYKKGKALLPKGVFLLQHEIKFFADSMVEFKRAEEEIPLALFTKVSLEEPAPARGAGGGVEDTQVGIAIETRHPDFKKLWLFPTSPALTQQWYGHLKRLLPVRVGILHLTDGKEKLERFVSFQGTPGALFTFGPKHFKLKRCYAAKKLCTPVAAGVTPDGTWSGTTWFELTETNVQERFRYLCPAESKNPSQIGEQWKLFLEAQMKTELQKEAWHAAELLRKEQEEATLAVKEAEDVQARRAAAAARKKTLEAKRQLLEEEDRQLDEEEAAEEEERRRAIAEEEERKALVEAEKARIKGQNAQDLFAEVDSDGSGAIDQQEFVELIRKLGLEWSQTQLEEAWAQIDVDHSELIELSEFEEWWIKEQKKRIDEMMIQVEETDAETKALRLQNKMKESEILDEDQLTKETIENLTCVRVSSSS